jgi:hypothetical protein
LRLPPEGDGIQDLQLLVTEPPGQADGIAGGTTFRLKSSAKKAIIH